MPPDSMDDDSVHASWRILGSVVQTTDFPLTRCWRSCMPHISASTRPAGLQKVLRGTSFSWTFVWRQPEEQDHHEWDLSGFSSWKAWKGSRFSVVNITPPPPSAPTFLFHLCHFLTGLSRTAREHFWFSGFHLHYAGEREATEGEVSTDGKDKLCLKVD